MNEDFHSDSRLSHVLPDIAFRWRSVRDRYYKEHKMQLCVSQGFRSYQEQWELYAIGRKKDHTGNWVVVNPKIVVTHARGGESLHNYGLALDSAFLGADPYLAKLPKKKAEFFWAEYGRIVKEEGLEWGGDWAGKKVDRPHCQKTFDLDLKTLQSLLQTEGLSGVFNRCEHIMECGKVMV